MHPLDLGMLLITYADGACLYSLKDGSTKRYYECILPADGANPPRKPALTCAVFSPDGEYVLVGCVDGTFAFFEFQNDEAPLQVRTMNETDINLPRKHFQRDEIPLQYDPIIDLKWCCRVAPNDSFLLIAGGTAHGLRGVNILDFGKPPTKAQELSEFFATPQRQRVLPIDPKEHVLELLTLGTASPFHNAHDPRCVLLVTGTGTSLLLDLPNGEPTSTEIVPPSLGFSTPQVTTFASVEIQRHLLNQLEHINRRAASRRQPLLNGGALASRTEQDVDNRQVLCSVHAGCMIRIYEMYAGTPLGTPLVEIKTFETLPNTIVERVALSGSTGELVVASESGTLVVYRFKSSNGTDDLAQAMVDLNLVEPLPSPVAEANNMLYKFDFPTRGPANFYPLCILPSGHGQISAMCVSDVGFVAVGYDSGYFVLIDLRGPAIFYASTCTSMDAKRRESIFRRSGSMNTQASNEVEYVTAVSVMTVALDERNSLVVLVGTSLGRCVCLELLKEDNGVFTALLSSVLSTGGASPIINIVGCNAFSENVVASGRHMALLHTDSEDADCVILISEQYATSHVGLSHRTARTTFRGSGAVSAQIVGLPNAPQIVVLAVVQRSGGVEFFSIPELQFLGSKTLLGEDNLRGAHITTSGELVRNSDKRELSLTSLLHGGNGTNRMDLLYDALKEPVIPRPTISNWTWVTGTQWVQVADLDLLITGGIRPLSKRALERHAASQRQQALLDRESAAADKARLQSARNVGGYDRTSGRNAFGDMQQGGQERGERVSHVSDVFDNISKASGEWLTEIDKMTSNAKKSAGKAALKSFLGF